MKFKKGDIIFHLKYRFYSRILDCTKYSYVLTTYIKGERMWSEKLVSLNSEIIDKNNRKLSKIETIALGIK